MPPKRLTVDVMVFRDYLEPTRVGHANARRLLELHRAGEVELAAAASGYFIDTTTEEPSGKRISGDLGSDLRALFEEEGISETMQLAYPGVMVPGPNAFPGAAVEGLFEAWSAVLDSWRTDEGRKPEPADQLHVETHILEARDVFVTNERGLLAMCRRLRDEHHFAVKAMSVAEYLASR
jgi:hypothetical protein